MAEQGVHHLDRDHAGLLGDGDTGVATGEADAVHSRVGHDVVTDLAATARHDVDRAWGHASLVERLQPQLNKFSQKSALGDESWQLISSHPC